MHVCHECGGVYDDSYTRCPRCLQREVESIDRSFSITKASTSRAVEHPVLEGEKPMEVEVRWGVRIAGLAFIVYLLGSLYSQYLIEQLDKIRDLEELASIAQNLDTLGAVTFWALIVLMGAIVYTLSAIGAALGFHIVLSGPKKKK